MQPKLFFDQFGITIPCLATYFQEVAARLSLKVAMKGSDLQGLLEVKRL